ncbi:MAG: GTP-binding protein [Hyphomicrobiaceae bacterium]
MIPVSVLTGFLGSGKTTVLARLLRRPEFSRTAVIINEFGEVGLDHDLVEASDESLVQLQTGCLCCAVRGDLVRTLEDLLRRRDDGTVPPFERVLIETSGLADPAPILQSLMLDAALAGRLALHGVVTTVDAVNGVETLRRQPESVKQVAVADRLLLTKADLVEDTGEVRQKIAALNPSAPIIAVTLGEVDPERLFDASDHASAHHHHEHDHHHHADTHASDIAFFAIVREEPIAAIALTLFLEALAEHCGADLLRLKGIIRVTENADRPAVIHGVQHVFHPPTWLERWPSPDRTSRLVFITRGLSRPWIEALLAAIEAEVHSLGGIET